MRVRAFRGSKMVQYMTDPANKKFGLDKITTRQQAVELCTKLLASADPV